MHAIKALRQKRADLAQQAQALITAVETRGDGFTADERTKLDTLHAELDTVNGDIERHDRHTAHLREVGAAAANPRQAQDVPQTGGFANLAEMAMAVRAAYSGGGPTDERLLRIGAAPTQVHNSGGDEGFEIPPAFRDQIWTLVFDDPFISRVNFEPTSSNVTSFIADESTPWAATGVQAYWRGEGSVMSPTKVVTRMGTQRIHSLYAFVNATDELLDDAPRLNARMTLRASQAIRWKMGAAIINGDGAGKPLGFRTAACKVEQAKETGQTAVTIVTKNISKMYSRQLDVSNAFWIANQDTLSQLMELSIGNSPVWVPPSQGFKEAPGGFLLGKPVVFSDHCATLGTVGDIQFLNMDGYYASQRQGASLATSIHLYFDYGVQTFRWTVRIGGQPFLSAAVSPANGSNTRSHFVDLATRA